jgi:hypothetical protein
MNYSDKKTVEVMKKNLLFKLTGEGEVIAFLVAFLFWLVIGLVHATATGDKLFTDFWGSWWWALSNGWIAPLFVWFTARIVINNVETTVIAESIHDLV